MGKEGCTIGFAPPYIFFRNEVCGYLVSSTKCHKSFPYTISTSFFWDSMGFGLVKLRFWNAPWEGKN